MNATHIRLAAFGGGGGPLGEMGGVFLLGAIFFFFFVVGANIQILKQMISVTVILHSL